MIVTGEPWNCKAYAKFLADGLWRFLGPELLRCPGYSKNNPCHTTGWGTRRRKPKKPSNILGNRPVPTARKTPIQRICCTVHETTFSILPPCLLPFIHYMAPIVDDCVEGYMKGETVRSLLGAYLRPVKRTVCRWIAKLRQDIDAVKGKALRLFSEDFYTTDERLIKEQKELFRESKRLPRLLDLWALLRSVAIRRSEGRTPYHYAIARAP